MKVFTKESLAAELLDICNSGWIRSHKPPGNAGAVGNALERLLDIPENNIPLPNAAEWELKGQRRGTSLLTLFHMDPSPRAMRLIPNLLLPKYGWPLKDHENEKSFRLTIGTTVSNDRGFRVVVDDVMQRVAISFDANQVGENQYDWLQSVKERVGLGELDPQPYWGFNDLEHKAGTKLKNLFYVLADSKVQDAVEYFWYNGILMLETFDFGHFLAALRAGTLKIDFDARSGHGRKSHNHGTKFRIHRNLFPSMYARATRILDEPLSAVVLSQRIDPTQTISINHPLGNNPSHSLINKNIGHTQMPLLEVEDRE
jgi:hypothetical protein